MVHYGLAELVYVLSGPSDLQGLHQDGSLSMQQLQRHRHSESDALCPSNWKHLFSRQRFDLTLCYVELLPLIPLAILLLCGSFEAWSLRRLPQKRLSGFRGLGLYRIKLVS